MNHTRSAAASCWLLSLCVATASSLAAPPQSTQAKNKPPAESKAPTQKTPAEVHRVRGVIDADETWSGHVLVTDNVTIDGATVTVEAGTVIEFAGSGPRAGPLLLVGGPQNVVGRLQVNATADKPIVFRTRPGTSPGRIVVHLRPRLTRPDMDPEKPPQAPPPPQKKPASERWSHIRFEGLGMTHVRTIMKERVQVASPSVSFILRGAAHNLALTDCSFVRSTRLQVIAADGSRVRLERNRDIEPTDRVALEVMSLVGQAMPAEVVIAGNRLSRAIHLGDLPFHVFDNILIGPDAAIAIKSTTARAAAIENNYVHNTTPDDSGRHGLDCRNPQARVVGNIIRGGSVCVLNGTRHMSGNVFIGAPSLRSSVSRAAKTSQLVSSLPRGSLFERNLLLGPAYTLLVPQATTGPAAPADSAADQAAETIVRNNLFDGFGATQRAVHLGRLGRASNRVSLLRNAFVRVSVVVLYEGSGEVSAVLSASGNAAAPKPRRFVGFAGETDKPEPPGLSIVADDLASFLLSATPSDRVAAFDDALTSGKLTVASLREQLFEAYRPRRGSPLAPTGDAKTLAGKQWIGPLEPKNR